MDSAIPVEVERKFVIPDDIEERLSSLNAQHTKNITFTDEYLDTKDNRLALSDVWLRRRDGRYQLKHAPLDRVNADVNQYKETDDKEYIRQHVASILSEPSIALDDFDVFATMTTHRKKYILGATEIDLDSTDFGYNIGEVEVMSTDANSLQESVDKVNEVITLLGVQCVGQHAGKMMTYLSTHNDELLSKIRVALNI